MRTWPRPSASSLDVLVLISSPVPGAVGQPPTPGPARLTRPTDPEDSGTNSCINLEEKVEKSPVTLRLMTHPGVGPLTALAYELVIGTPERFWKVGDRVPRNPLNECSKYGWRVEIRMAEKSIEPFIPNQRDRVCFRLRRSSQRVEGPSSNSLRGGKGFARTLYAERRINYGSIRI